jgi:hypothetical protein
MRRTAPARPVAGTAVARHGGTATAASCRSDHEATMPTTFDGLPLELQVGDGVVARGTQ